MKEISTGSDSTTATDIVATGDAARVLGVSTAAVRKMAERGELRPVQKLPGRLGAYLFARNDVEALAATRAAALEAKLAALRAGGAA